MSVASIAPAAGSMTPTRPVTMPPPSTASVSAANSTPPPSFGATILAVSTPAQLLVKMRQLSMTNPEEFKILAAEMGGTFARAAGAASGTDAQLLAKVASQFTQAATSGSLSAADTGSGAPDTRALEGSSAIAGSDAFSVGGRSHHGRGSQAGRDASAWSSSAVRNAFGEALDAFDQATGSAASI